VQRKTVEKDGYEAIQLGYIELKKRAKTIKSRVAKTVVAVVAKPMAQRADTSRKTAAQPPTRHLAEFKLSGEGEEPTAGSSLTVDALFKAGDDIKVQGTSKGRGFAGVMKRHNFRGQGASHGSKIHRKAASNGATDPARTFPGARRPGRFGAELVTQKGLQVVEVDTARNLLVVKGAVPGANGGLLRIEKAKSKKRNEQIRVLEIVAGSAI
jgi:large subunit ribosomal protein L3